MIQNKSTDEYDVEGLYIFSNPHGADIYRLNPVRYSAGNIVKAPAILTDIPQGLHSYLN